MEQLKKKLFLIIDIVAVILIITAISSSLVRIALSLAFILFFPGYGITAILFPRRALDLSARILLSVALSLATTALIGLLMHLTPWGIQWRNPVFIVFLGGTGILGLYFLVRDIVNTDRATILPQIGFSSRQTLLLALAAVIVTIAINIARTPVSPKNLEGYTLFWVQPSDRADTLKLGVQSEEFETTKYQLRYQLDNVVHEGPTFELKSGQTWGYILKLDGDNLAGQPVTLLLYRLDHPNEIYRRVIWWL